MKQAANWIARYERFWEGQFDSLAKYLNERNKRRTAMTTVDTSTQTLKLRVSRTFDAPRERVFQAWTDPEKLKKWFRPDESIAIMLTRWISASAASIASR